MTVIHTKRWSCSWLNNMWNFAFLFWFFLPFVDCIMLMWEKISGSLLLGGHVEKWHIPSGFLNPRNFTETVLMLSAQSFYSPCLWSVAHSLAVFLGMCHSSTHLPNLQVRRCTWSLLPDLPLRLLSTANDKWWVRYEARVGQGLCIIIN